MTNDIWTRAQQGEKAYWQTEQARLTEGTPETRRDFWNAYLDKIRAHRPFQPGDRVLDVGCGPAGIITAIEDFCDRYGADPLLDFYREEYDLSSDIHYSQQMAESLEFPDNHFPVVTCMNMFDHTLRPEAVWTELHRILEPGGLLLFEIDTFNGFEYYRKKFKRWTRKLRGKIEKHPHTFSITHILTGARKAGFDILEHNTRPHRKRLILLTLLQKSTTQVRTN